jgi:hypothetical protein
MVKNDTSFYGNFLVGFLNLELNISNVCKLLKQCNKIIPVNNINDCIDLLLNYEEMTTEQLWKKLPTKSKRQIGKFYREPKNKNYIHLYWEIGIYSGHQNVTETHIPIRSINGLQSEISEIKKDLTALIKSMISLQSFSDIFRDSYFIIMADNYPGDKIYIENDTVVLKPEYPPYWSFRHVYIEKCISYAFFKYFMIDKNFKRIRFCSVCSLAFVAKDLKRTICYSLECEKKYRRLQKRDQREKDPVRYL